MKNITLLGMALFAATACMARAEQDVITKSFPVQSGGKLVMKVDRGGIQITTSDSDKVDIRVVRELKRISAAEAKDVFEKHKIDISSAGNEVKIQAENPQKGQFGRNNPFNHLQV